MTTPSAPRPPAWLSRGRLVSATKWLVALAALLNALFDIAAAVLQWPRTEAEADNTDLFALHFQEAPQRELQWSVEAGNRSSSADFRAFKNGDVFIRFDSLSQWFRSPTNPRKQPFLLALIPGVNAQGLPPAGAPPAAADATRRAPVELRFEERLEGTRLIRYQELRTGQAEELQFDIRTGKVLSRSIVPATQVFKSTSPRSLVEYRAINLQALPGGKAVPN